MHRFVATLVSVLVGLLVSLPAFGAKPTKTKITLIHMGDIHGHLVPQPNLTIDPSGAPVGGLARLYTQIQNIRNHSPNALLINAGDTIQGSAEVLYTKGSAMVNVLNGFGIDAFAPGNWDYVYGLARFQELFVN